MKILVCGAHLPFAIDGPELHTTTLVGELRAAGHLAELVRLPAAADGFRSLDARLAWRLVPLDADLVVCTDVPSCFASNANKVAWLSHLDLDPHGHSVDASREVDRLAKDWDDQALREARHVFTTSGAAADRLLHVNGLLAEPLPHPPPLHDRLRPGPFGDYILVPPPLGPGARPDLFVSALAHSSSPVRLVVAGAGPMHSALVELAAAAGTVDRLELTGQVDDDQLVDLYAGACAVACAPSAEDQRPLTQAFFAGKPVVTSVGSRPLDWVVDGVTAVVTDGTPRSIGKAYDTLAADSGLARSMGDAGHERVAGLAWSSVLDALLAA